MNSINRKFGRSFDGKTITYFKGYIETDDGIILNPSEEQIINLAHQFYVIDEMPQKEGYYYTATGWQEDENTKTVTHIFEEHKIEPSFDDYDNAMEEHIRQTRFDRGYTTREPNAYINSSVEKFSSDAKDWQKFLDETMLYGMKVRDDYARTGIAPTLEEFKENLPQIKWTYEEDEGNQE